MQRSTADGLAGAGALLVAFSLLLPWYGLRAGTFEQTLDARSGAQALGALSWLVVAAAFVAGWSGIRRVAPAIPAVAAGVLLLIVAVKWLDPPAAASILSARPGADPLTRALTDATLTAAGLRFEPVYGLYVAAAGAAMVAAGSYRRSR